jgi:hypothetical protein
MKSPEEEGEIGGPMSPRWRCLGSAAHACIDDSPRVQAPLGNVNEMRGGVWSACLARAEGGRRVE